jgi:hypothetical protein
MPSNVIDLRNSNDCPIVVIVDGSGGSFSNLFKAAADFPGVTRYGVVVRKRR